LFEQLGVLWLAREGNDYLESSYAALQRRGIPVERLSLAEVQRRFPQFAPLDSQVALFEPEAGALHARLAVRAIHQAFERQGGRVLATAVAGVDRDGFLTASGERIRAGQYVLACGPWLPRLLPDLLGPLIRVTKQDVFFFGPPAGTGLRDMPIWIDEADVGGDRGFSYYGLPPFGGRDIKVASDVSGPEFDPSHGERAVSADSLTGVRSYLAARVPAMAAAPLVETRVCQYERTPDTHLLLDCHPEWPDVWIAGGGSGHGFKLGPVVGRLLADCLVNNDAGRLPPEVRLARFHP
jgi:glycine/D-amino acid oxidase-like deaminating enzyme